MKNHSFSMIALLLAGCTNQQIYNAVQENRRMECGKLPQNQYEQCMRDYDTSYDEYVRERRASMTSGSNSPPAAAEHSVTAADNVEWGLLNPLRGDASPGAADLWGDRTKNVATGMLVKFEKGFASPPHIHNITYRGVVIKGLMHNDDPSAERMWLPPGSFWTQPAGETHITAAGGDENLIYLEIDSGPYLVRPAGEAFDNGERPINVDERNLVWLGAQDVKWVKSGEAKLAYLWGETHLANGSFVKLSAGFQGTIEANRELKGVVVSGTASYSWNNEAGATALSPGSFFRSRARGEHNIRAETDLVLYINSYGRYNVE